MAHHRGRSHPYGRVLLSVGNMHIEYGVPRARGDQAITIRIQKFEKCYHELLSIHSSSGRGLHLGVSYYRCSLFI
jgi:hypothetical protein